MKTIHNTHTILNIYFPKVKYDWDNATQTFTWISEIHPTIEELNNLVIQENIKEQENEVRTKRNKLLQESDFIVIKSLEYGTNIPDVWKIYRQKLRDLTEDTNFPNIENIVFPNKPE